MHRIVGMVLAFLNCHMYIRFMVVSVVGRLMPGIVIAYLSVAITRLLLAITIITAYWITSDGCALRWKEQAAYH